MQSPSTKSPWSVLRMHLSFPHHPYQDRYESSKALPTNNNYITIATATTLLYSLLTIIVIPNPLLEFHLFINHQQTTNKPTTKQTTKQTNNCDNVQPTQRLCSPDQLWPFYRQLFQPLLQLICPLCGIQLPLRLQCPRV